MEPSRGDQLLTATNIVGASSMNVTFLLPGDGYYGGARVTAEMGTCLMERGHAVRIAYRVSSTLSLRRARSLARAARLYLEGVKQTSWLSGFSGRKEPFVRLDELDFSDGEIVIATGTDTIEDLSTLNRNVRKLRYCHGLLEHEPEHVQKRWLWSGPMDTIAVSPALVPKLEQLCEGRVLGVVPNGIRTDEYFVENRLRDGVGLVFSSAAVKGPEVAVALVKALAEGFPELSRYAFGGCRRLRQLYPCDYTRLPTVDRAREIYNRCKIWLITSRDEGFSLPMLEAMACGCAVISSRHTNASEIIQHGVNGFTVPYGDIASYMEYIGRLLQDEELRRRMVQEGLKTAKRFTWEKAADRLEQVLQSLIVGPSDGSRSFASAERT